MIRDFAGRSCAVIAGSLIALAAPLAADTFPVDLSSDQFTLYTDPNTGSVIKLGGFSALIPGSDDEGGRTFFTITDRGPNVDFPPPPSSSTGKAFVVPGFAPSIVTLKLKRNGTAVVQRILPLRKPNGELLSGRPGPCYLSEDPLADLSGNPVARDPDGLDTEGLTAGPEGTFWISEEYAPSVAMVTPRGVVAVRLVPRGAICGGERVPTLDVLPGVYTKRVANRGLEGITYAEDSGRLYAVLQRPLANPKKATSEASRNIRILELDVRRILSGRTDGALRQLLYITEPSSSQKNVHAADIFSLSAEVFLVPERKTDKAFAICIDGATDITSFEDSSGKLLTPFQPDPSLPAKTTIEELSPAELATLGIQPVRKQEILASFTAFDPVLEKVEGLCASGGRLVFCQDNDFNLLTADFSVTPAKIILQDPPNLPKLFTAPLPPIRFPGHCSTEEEEGDQDR